MTTEVATKRKQFADQLVEAEETSNWHITTHFS